MIQLLPRTPRPIFDESYPGYCLRLQSENGLDSLSKLFKARTLKEKIRNQQPSAQILNALTNHHFDWLVGRDEREHIINGHSVTHQLMGDCSICIDCIQESGYHHSIFDLKAVTACIKHKKQLLHTCPSCYNLDHHRMDLLVCNCRFDLANSKTETADPRQLELLQVVSAVVNNTALTNAQSHFGMPLSYLSRLPLNTLLVIIESIGRSQCALLDQKNQDPTPLQVTQAAADIFSDWPNNFHQFLEDYGTYKSVSFNHKFADWNMAHAALFNEPYPLAESRFMLDEYYQSLGRDAEWGSMDHRRLAIHEHATMAQYAMVTGDTLRGVEAKLMAGELFFVKRYLMTQTIKFHKQTSFLHRIEHDQASYITEQACLHLGISLGLFTAIKKSGFLLLNYKSDKASTYAVPDLDHFKAAFLSMQSKHDMPDDGVRLSTAFQMMRGCSQYFVGIIQEILKGNIAIYGDEDEILDVFISEAEMKELFSTFRRGERVVQQLYSDQVKCVDSNYLNQLEARGLIQPSITTYREFFQT